MWMFVKTWIQYLQIHYHDPPPSLLKPSKCNVPMARILKKPVFRGCPLIYPQKTCFQGGGALIYLL